MKKEEKAKQLTEKTRKEKLLDRKIHSFSPKELKELAQLVKKMLIEQLKAGNSPLLIHCITNFFESPREILEGERKAESFKLLEGIADQILKLDVNAIVDKPNIGVTENPGGKKIPLPAHRVGRVRKKLIERDVLRNAPQKKSG